MDARAYMDRTWLEVDLDALERNVRKCRSIIGPNCALTAVVKSDAYGLGAIPVARALWAMGVDMLAVACLSEARVLRAALPDAQIMILGDTPIRRMGEAAAMNLVCTVWTREQVCAAANCGLRVHAKIDTGFHRLGFDCRENALAELAGVLKQPGLRLEGIYSHLALVNREEDERQLERFDTARAYLRAQGIAPRYFHIDDSIGMVRYPEHQLDMVRVGAFLYGVWPARYTDPITAEPVIAALKARVTHLSHLEPGEGAGYDYLFRAQRPTVLATVCAGYGDGPAYGGCDGYTGRGGGRRGYAVWRARDTHYGVCRLGRHQPQRGDSANHGARAAAVSARRRGRGGAGLHGAARRAGGLKNRFATMALGAANGAMCRRRAVMRGGTGPR